MKRYLFISILIVLSVALFAGGAPEEETEIFLSQAPQYISPGNPATGKDTLTIENIQISIQDSAAITSYELRIYDKRGEIIYSVQEENLEGRGFFEEIFDIGELPSVKVPESIVWDGRDNNGNFVENGEYFYQLYVRDSRDKRTFTAPLAVIVDTVQPEIVQLSASTQVFSPNDDGKQDSISFVIQSGPAEQWLLEVQSASGASVLSTSAVSEGDTAASDVLAPQRFEWDGKNSAGALASDGRYRFRLRGLDRAGNSVEQRLDFVLSTSAANITVDIDNNNPYFSFQNRNAMNFFVSLNETAGLQDWRMEILDEDDIVFRRFAGTAADLPETISFNGRGNAGRPESDSLPLDDGEYQVLFTASYNNGNVSLSDELNIYMDNTAPESYLTADSAPRGRELRNPIYFGGSAKPYLLLNAGYEESVDWNVVIIYQRGEEIVVPLSSYLEQGLRFPFSWDGTNPFTGQPAPDGGYQVFLRAEDQAGNVGISDVARFVKDSASRAATAIELSIPEPGLVRITPKVPVLEGVEHFVLSIINENDGRTYFIRQVREVLPYIDWEGRRNNNSSSPLGTYRVEMDILYLNGDNVVTQGSQIITLGPDGPTVDSLPDGGLRGFITIDGGFFSPDGDGLNDTVRMTLESNSQSISMWKLEILDPVGNLFKSWEGTGLPPGEVEWDGLGDNGELVQSAADYTALLSLADTLGNESVSAGIIPVDILVIVDGDRLRINVPSIYFAPNTSDLFDVGSDEQDRNFKTLRRLAEILNRFDTFAIAVEGHAVQLLSGPAGQSEQTNVLIPLSRSRALEVKQALSILEVEWDRMTVRGYGGAFPIVPHDDLQNRWKNRRVEFILEKQ